MKGRYRMKRRWESCGEEMGEIVEKMDRIETRTGSSNKGGARLRCRDEGRRGGKRVKDNDRE